MQLLQTHHKIIVTRQMILVSRLYTNFTRSLLTHTKIIAHASQDYCTHITSFYIHHKFVAHTS